MDKFLIAACMSAALLCSCSEAKADGNVLAAVTLVKAAGANFPDAYQFQTKDGPTWYCLLKRRAGLDPYDPTTVLDEPTYNEAKDHIQMSRWFRFPVSFDIVPFRIGCPTNSQSVAGVVQ